MSEIIDQMIKALDLEIAAIRKRGGGTRVELYNGCYFETNGTLSLYKFGISDSLSIRDESPCQVTIDSEKISGSVVSCYESVLIVSLEKNVGEIVTKAQLVTNDSSLIERLKDRLQAIKGGSQNYNIKAAERVFGIETCKTAMVEPDKAFWADKQGDANSEQRDAIRHSLGSETTFLWGPPGTGKTSTLAHIIEAHYHAGHSILLVSNTNVAVDTALKKVIDKLKGEPSFHEGLVIRKGPVVGNLKEFENRIAREAIIKRLGKKLLDEKDYLEKEEETLRLENVSILELLAIFEQTCSMQKALADRENKIAVLKAKIHQRESEAGDVLSKIARLRIGLDEARSKNAVVRFFLGLDPEKIAKEIRDAEYSVQLIRNAAQALSDDLPKLNSEVELFCSKIEKLVLRVPRDQNEQESRNRQKAILLRITQIQKRLKTVAVELKDLENKVDNNCRVLAATAYKIYLNKEQLSNFDVVVVDEASMLMAPIVYLVATMAKRHVTIAGDFRQLPPIVISTGPLAEKWLARDVFEIAGIPQKLKQNGNSPELVSLKTQYRMHEKICDVINIFFYSDRPLLTFNGSQNLISHPMFTAPLLYVNTSKYHPWAALKAGSSSHYNVTHAWLIRAIIVSLAKSGFFDSGSKDLIGVLSPYSAQAKLIKNLLDEAFEGHDVTSATVHRFQGNEKSVMIIDLTDSTGVKVSNFLTSIRAEDAASLTVGDNGCLPVKAPGLVGF